MAKESPAVATTTPTAAALTITKSNKKTLKYLLYLIQIKSSYTVYFFQNSSEKIFNIL